MKDLMSGNDYKMALSITPQFYRAAIEPSAWPDVLRLFAKAFEAPTAQFTLADLRTENVMNTAYYGISDKAIRTWLAIEDHAAIDPRVDHMRRRPNRPLTERHVMTEKEWHSSAIYQQFHKRYGFDSSLTTLTILEEEDIIAILGATRAYGARPFDESDTARFHLYLPHFREAARLASRLYRIETRNRTYTAIFDKLRIATLVTDRFSTVEYANAAARDLLDRGEGIGLNRGKLTAVNGAATAALRTEILRVTTEEQSRSADRHLVRLRRPERTSDLLLSISTLGQATDAETLFGQDLYVVLFLCDPEARYEGDTEAFQRLFGLTMAEAEVLRRLSSGDSLRGIATELDRSQETVRTHLKSVYRKTGVASRGELMRLVSAVDLPGRGKTSKSAN